MTQLSKNALRIAYAQVVDSVVINPNIKTARKYLAPNLVVKATRHGKFDARSHSQNIVLTVGRPDYKAREFIKTARKAGQQFPIQKLQFRLTPQKRA